MDTSKALEHATRYAKKVRKEFQPESIVLFGSFINGTSHTESDIDIAVIFNGFDGQFWETSSRLWRLSFDVDTSIEPHLLDKADDSTGFVQEILRTGILLQ